MDLGCPKDHSIFKVLYYACLQAKLNFCFFVADTIALGNPGSGKSTILNSLAGEVKFKSGISHARGLTHKFEEHVNQRGKFLDTPGRVV